MKITLTILSSFFVYLVLSLATLLMLRLAVDYSSFRTDIHFLQKKQAYLPNTCWRVAFYVHVFSAVFALMAGFTQFSDYILKQSKAVHRWVGKMYVAVILILNFPAAMVMAFYANGLWPSRLAFIILDCAWFYFTWRAYAAARQKDIVSHKQFMIRSYALTFSAITLRAWKIVLLHAFNPDPLTLYMIQAWIGFVPNLLFAEWLIRRRKKSANYRSQVSKK
jgi:uncharacterized membrane protein